MGPISNEKAFNQADLFALWDQLMEDREGEWWDRFYHDRAKPCPFFVEWPDESLADRLEKNTIAPGKVLDLGCGPGRNAIYLAQKGFQVTAVDFSADSLKWAQERANKAEVEVDFLCTSIFDLNPEPESYDYIYDSGCLHHLFPHRRLSYLELVLTALKPGGYLSLVCFNEEGGSGLTDGEAYQQRTIKGGLGYSEEELREFFAPHLEVIELRQMRKTEAHEKLFGENFLWTALFKKM